MSKLSQDDVRIECYENCTEELFDILASLESRIFEDPYSREKLERESRVKHQLLALVAYAGNQPCGFKVGYEMTSRIFYSWIGGVVAEFRGNGIARMLMQHQHRLAKEMDYSVVRTHTENRFRDMLLLNIRSGFDIVGVCSEQNGKTIIVLDKSL